MFDEKFLNFIRIWQEDFVIDKTIEQKASIDKNNNPIPWYTYPAIEYLSQFDYSDKDIFEFGCGNSSLFWAERARSVTSIEDNPTWFEKWNRNFHKENLSILLRDEGKNYYDAILENNKTFDVIVIDGKNRAECAKNAVQQLKNGGFIILDDSDRINTSKEYIDAVKYLKEADLIQIDFFGFCPMNVYTKTTSLFLSRNFTPKTIQPTQPANGLGNLWGMPRKQRKEFYKNNI